MSEQVASN